MRLVWSQPTVRRDRPRRILLVAVVCLFLGGVLSGRPEISDSPRPVRAAIASLLATGALFLLAGAAAMAFPGMPRRRPPISLARPQPSDSHDAEPDSSLQEEEHR